MLDLDSKYITFNSLEVEFQENELGGKETRKEMVTIKIMSVRTRIMVNGWNGQ